MNAEGLDFHHRKVIRDILRDLNGLKPLTQEQRVYIYSFASKREFDEILRKADIVDEILLRTTYTA